LRNDCSFGFTTIDGLKRTVSAYFGYVYENCPFGDNRKIKFEEKCDIVKATAEALTTLYC